MSTLTPTITLSGSAADFGAKIALSVTDSLALSATGYNIQSQIVLDDELHTIIADASEFSTDPLASPSKCYVFLQNLSTTAAEVITVTHAAFNHNDCDINNATGITDITGIHGAKPGMNVYHSSTTGRIPVDSRITTVSSATNLVMSGTSTGGDLDDQTLTFANSLFTLGNQEFAFFPWSGRFDIGAHAAQGTPAIEVRIFKA